MNKISLTLLFAVLFIFVNGHIKAQLTEKKKTYTDNRDSLNTEKLTKQIIKFDKINENNYEYWQNIGTFQHNFRNQKRHNNTLYFLGFFPSKANVINGWTIGDFSLYSSISRKHQVKMNGLYTNLDPLQPILGIYIIAETIYSIFGNKNSYLVDNGSIYSQINNIDTHIYNNRQLNFINGISFGITYIGCDSELELKTNGVEFSVISQYTYENNGISISGLVNKKTKFKGIMIGLINISKIGKGLQIGLINNCGDCNGFQIGLFNRCGKRILPIINFRFKREKNKKRHTTLYKKNKDKIQN